jgi:hypothetical protein
VAHHRAECRLLSGGYAGTMAQAVCNGETNPTGLCDPHVISDPGLQLTRRRRSTARQCHDRVSDGEVAFGELTPRADRLRGGGAVRPRERDQPFIRCSQPVEQLELPVAREQFIIPLNMVEKW